MDATANKILPPARFMIKHAGGSIFSDRLSENLPGYRDFPDLPDVQQEETDSIDPITGSAVIVAVVPLGEWMPVRE